MKEEIPTPIIVILFCFWACQICMGSSSSKKAESCFGASFARASSGGASSTSPSLSDSCMNASSVMFFFVLFFFVLFFLFLFNSAPLATPRVSF